MWTRSAIWQQRLQGLLNRAHSKARRAARANGKDNGSAAEAPDRQIVRPPSP